MPATSATVARRTVTPGARVRASGTRRLLATGLARDGDGLAEDADEALGVARLVAGHVERRQLGLVERARAGACHRAGAAVEHLDRDRAGDRLERLVDE